MPQFSKKSLQKLATCDPRLQMICHEAIKTIDFTVICGHRGEDEQNKAYKDGKSKLQWPYSKHNSLPSMAVDVAPIKYIAGQVSIDWADIGRFKTLADLFKDVAKETGISIEWGGDWTMFKDYPHIQLADPKKSGIINQPKETFNARTFNGA